MGKYTTIIYTWPHSLECEKCKNGISLMDTHAQDMGATCKIEYDKVLDNLDPNLNTPRLKFLEEE